MRWTSSLVSGDGLAVWGGACVTPASGHCPRGAPLRPYTVMGCTAEWWKQWTTAGSCPRRGATVPRAALTAAPGPPPTVGLDREVAVHLTRRVGPGHAHHCLQPQEAVSKVLTCPTCRKPLHMEDGMPLRLRPPQLSSATAVGRSPAVHCTKLGVVCVAPPT